MMSDRKRPSERERLVQDTPEVIEGDDPIPRQPVRPLDEYTVEPHNRPGQEWGWKAMRLAWIPFLVAAAILIVWGIFFR